jgi:uncharacterized repeat protein (TIGR03803 family)
MRSYDASTTAPVTGEADEAKRGARKANHLPKGNSLTSSHLDPCRWSVAMRALSAACILALGAPAAHADSPLNIVHEFGGGSTGQWPYAGLLLAKDGYFYGSTSGGLTDDWGTLYRVKPDGSDFSTVHVFSGGADGGWTETPLLQGQDGALYGASAFGSDGQGGQIFAGSVFRLTLDGQFTVLHTFNPDTGDGGVVTQPLAQDANGTLYGASTAGGALQQGSIFSVRPDGTGYKILHEFDGGIDGGSVESVAIGSNGKLFALAYNGGTTGDGTIVMMNTDGSGFKKLHDFDHTKGEGRHPRAGLVALYGDAFLYGTSEAGGAYDDAGTVFRINAKGKFETLHSFFSIVDGIEPFAPLTVAPNGHILATTFSGAANTGGALVDFDSKFHLAGVAPLGGDSSTYSAGGSLAVGPDGRYYTPTVNGGAANAGTIVAIAPDAFPPVQPPLPQVFIAFPKQQVPVDKSIVMEWGASNAGHCEASGDWGGWRRPNGAIWVKRHEPGLYTFTVTCFSAYGSGTATTTLQVVPK